MTNEEPSNTATSDATHCSICGQHTHLNCSGCKLTFYCGSACQMKDWPAHKAACQDLKLEQALKRVANIVQDLFLQLLEDICVIDVKKVEQRDGGLVIHTDERDDVASPTWFREFPRDIVSDDPRDKMAVLTACHSSEPYGFLHPLFSKLLEGLKVDVDEIGLYVMGVPCETLTVSWDGECWSSVVDTQHKGLLFTSHYSGKQWYLDIAGGQLGITEPFHVWADYRLAFVRSVRAVWPFGFTHGKFARLARIKGMPDIVFGLVGEAAKVAYEAAETWAEQHTPLCQLRSLNDADFAREKTSLLVRLGENVRNFISANDFTVRVREAMKSKHERIAQEQMMAIGCEITESGKQYLTQATERLGLGLHEEKVYQHNSFHTKYTLMDLDTL